MSTNAIPASLTQAVERLPTILQPGDLSRKENITVEAVRERFYQIAEQLLIFSESYKWLRGAKQFHDDLTLLSEVFEQVNRVVMKTSNRSGGFDADRLDLEQAKEGWDHVRNAGLNKLISGAISNLYVGGEVLMLDEEGKYIAGPLWAKSFLAKANLIDGHFAEIGKGNMEHRSDIIDEVRGLGGIIRRELNQANADIKSRATFLSEKMFELQICLRNA